MNTNRRETALTHYLTGEPDRFVRCLNFGHSPDNEPPVLHHAPRPVIRLVSRHDLDSHAMGPSWEPASRATLLRLLRHPLPLLQRAKSHPQLARALQLLQPIERHLAHAAREDNLKSEHTLRCLVEPTRRGHASNLGGEGEPISHESPRHFLTSHSAHLPQTSEYLLGLGSRSFPQRQQTIRGRGAGAAAGAPARALARSTPLRLLDRSPPGPLRGDRSRRRGPRGRGWRRGDRPRRGGGSC